MAARSKWIPNSLEAVLQVEPGVYSVLLDGASYEIRLLAAPQGLSAEAGGRQLRGRGTRSPRRRRGSKSVLSASGRQNIVAPMPGKVVRVLVQKGDTRGSGQGLVVVEAMKMQNELKASRPGDVCGGSRSRGRHGGRGRYAGGIGIDSGRMGIAP